VSTATPRRRHPAAGLAVILAGLVTTGVGFAFVSASTSASAATPTSTASQVQAGRQLYIEGCSTCHGLGAQGAGGNPTLIGVGAAAVNFQVSTGRMPLAAPAVQAPRRTPVYNDEQVSDLAAYVASLGAGPAIPTAGELNTDNANLQAGGELFRTNCAQCHNFAGKGGALSEGAYAPSLMQAKPNIIYEAMLTGPQNMPVFTNNTITPESKRNIIAYVQHLQTENSPGGLALGSYGPVTEGVFIWIVGLGALLGAAVWVGAKVR
jgi:ubiquinol-cytochrome c reductase cytochrome c subunit